MRYYFISLFFLVIAVNCTNNKKYIPTHFPPPVRGLDFVNSKEVELGKMLFYEPALSGNNKLSCASCHNPVFAFSDSLPLSVGASGKKTFRNTPSLANLAWNSTFFRDGGVLDLETQVIGSITSASEMNEDFANILTKLSGKENYRTKFKEVYGSSTITGQRIIHAIAAFERMLISDNSTYDNYLLGKKSLTALQSKGLTVFQQKCSVCHAGVLFTDNNFHNNGLDTLFPSLKQFDAPELGRGRITRKTEDIGKYHTPSLRNLSLTAPYMHDGRFTTVMQVLNHYSEGVKKSAYTDSLLLKNAQGIPLTEGDKAALISFLQTLTDSSFTKK